MTILPYVHLALAAAFALAGMLFKLAARRELTWPGVPGTIDASRVEHGNDIDARLEYRYEFQGKLYQGNRICSLLMGVNWPQRAERWTARYPMGAAVTVYVNPQDPRFAVLERGGDPRFFTSMFSSAALALFMAYLSYDL